MHVKLILNHTAIVLIFISLFMLVPALVALVYGTDDLMAILDSFAITFGAGGFMFLATKEDRKKEIGHRDSFVVVTLSWIAMAVAGSLPFLLSGDIPSVTDAIFESMSGFTTTGSTILTDVEKMSRGVLFWRSLTHWIGGLGIIVFFVAVLPLMGVGGSQLFKAEASQVVPEKLRPRIIDTAKTLWKIYVVFTVVGVVVLYLEDMDLYDAFCHTFGAIGTGGFSTRNLSIGAYESSHVHYVIILLMLVGSTSFTLHYQALRAGMKSYIKNREFLFYASVIGTATVMIVASTYSIHHGSFLLSFRDALFQVVSIASSTGYSTVDYEMWPVFTQMLLVILMFIGGMAGSTTGGMKQVRVMLMMKQVCREIQHLIHPHVVSSIKLNNYAVSKKVLGSVWGFIFLFFVIWAAASLSLSALGVDIVTASSSALATMSNIGPGLGAVGPAENFASIPVVGKWILVMCMLVGRLEVYTIIILFMPHFWRK